MNLLEKEHIHEERSKAQEEFNAIEAGTVNWAHPSYGSERLNVGNYFNGERRANTEKVIRRFLDYRLYLARLEDPLQHQVAFRQAEIREVISKIFKGIDKKLNEESIDKAVKYFIRHADKNQVRKADEYGVYLYYGSNKVQLTYDYMVDVLKDTVQKIQSAEFSKLSGDNERNRQLISQSAYAIGQLNQIIKVFEDAK